MVQHRSSSLSLAPSPVFTRQEKNLKSWIHAHVPISPVPYCTVFASNFYNMAVPENLSSKVSKRFSQAHGNHFSDHFLWMKSVTQGLSLIPMSHARHDTHIQTHTNTPLSKRGQPDQIFLSHPWTAYLLKASTSSIYPTVHALLMTRGT